MTAARDCKNLCILPENSAGESAAGITYLSMKIDLTSCCIFPLKVSATLLTSMVQGRAQLEHSSCKVKIGVKATC